MSEFFNVRAIVAFPKIENVKFKDEKEHPCFNALFFFTEEDTKTIQTYFKPHMDVNKKISSHLKEIDRAEFSNVPEEYTHQMNMGSCIEYADFLDLYQNELDPAVIKFGDLVMISGEAKVTTQHTTNKKYLGAYLKVLALLKPGAVQMRQENKAKSVMIEMLNGLEAEFANEDTVPL